MEALDQYMLQQTVAVSEDLRRWYEEFAFHKIYQRVNHFCVVELSAFYFDVLKDRLYTYPAFSPARRSAQTALWRILEALVRLLAPITSFTCDEVWTYLPKREERAESVHLTYFPTAEQILGSDSPVRDAKQAEEWTTLLSVREQVLKALEEARHAKRIGVGLEAQVTLSAAEPVYSVLSRFQADLRYLFIVSAVKLEPRTAGNGSSPPVSIQISRAEGAKCERCWNYSTHVGENATYPGICERCSAALEQIEGQRRGSRTD
jgi:isoleucyl-tRNA synthetase